jgi:phage tail sheath protein FI
MAAYLAPGVYVNEIPPTVVPIRGVSLSTAAFIGVYADDYIVPAYRITGETIGYGDGEETTFKLKGYPVVTSSTNEETKPIGYVNSAAQSDVVVSNDAAQQISTMTFETAPTKNAVVSASYTLDPPIAEAGVIVQCFNFADFERAFGSFAARDSGIVSTGPDQDDVYNNGAAQSNFAFAVYGFFNNGGTHCYALRVESMGEVPKALELLAPIDDIGMVAVPGVSDRSVQQALFANCAVATKSRVAILDSPEELGNPPDIRLLSVSGDEYPGTCDYAAYYYPWIQVYDTASGKNVYVPPSGFVAGIYARTDADQGMYKAPANQQVLGAVGLKYLTSDAQQDQLNPQGINCIRRLGGNILVWGARVLCGASGSVNGITYISTRRYLIYLEKSIEQATQWVVFEPNSIPLWAKITRNVSDFLYNEWRAGGLFGKTPAEAYYVRCDESTNPPSVRELGQVVTEVGVSIVKPAEFVIFNIFQFTNGSSAI